MNERLVVRGGTVIDPVNGTNTRLDMLIADGVVARIAPDMETEGALAIDATGCLVVPGFIDLHAHLREPGFEQKGTVATETAAALAGGFTTVCAMPNTEPPPDSAPTVEALLERISRDARVRVLPIGCITRGRAGKQPADLGELAAAGCVAFSDDGNPVADARIMRAALALAGALGVPISEHSDDPVLNAGGVMNEGRVSERLGLKGQPAAAEASAIARNIELCAMTGARLHLAHITTARSVELVADAKARRLPVTCEVTPSHLFLTEDAVFGTGAQPAYDTNARINPPLRTEEDRRALLRGLADGTIDAIATDHAPHAAEDKLCEFDLAAPGISCIETALGTILLLVERGELDLAIALNALTAGPSRVFNIESRIPGAGQLREGISTDLLVIDPAVRNVVEASSLLSKGKNTPLLGTELPGLVRTVILAGRVVRQVEAASV
jgi:dihydroorotase